MIDQILKEKGFSLKKKTNNEYAGPCPFCGGEDRFIVWPEENRAHCIRGCEWKGDDIQLLRDLDGLSFQEAAEVVGRGNIEGRGKSVPKNRNENGLKNETKKITYRWDYQDLQGNKVYQVQRLDYPNGKKDYPTFPYNGDGQLHKGKDPMKGIKRILYRLPDLQRYKSAPVWIPEGEKCVDLLCSLDIRPATCNPGGARKWPNLVKEYSIDEPLKDRTVYILPDNDEPGRKHAEDIAQSLYGKAKEIKILDLPGLPEKGDVYDFHKIHGQEKTIETLIRLTKEIEPWKPPSIFFSAKDLINTSFERHRPVIEKGILPHGGHILIAGETGVGKSLLRMEMGLHLIMGWEWLGFHIPTAKRVAVFQYENPESTEQARLSRMCMGLGIDIRSMPDNCLIYADRRNRVNLSLKGDREKLFEIVKQSEAEVIFYDCLSNLHAGDENKNMQLREVVDVLADINAKAGTSCVLIHHFGKGGNPDARKIDRIRGASSLVDWAMTAITFTVRYHESKILRQLDFVKVRDGATPKPILCERDENFLLSITDEDSLCPPGKVKELLEEMGGYIESQRPLIEAIISDSGCGERSARKYLYRAIELKYIKELNQGNGKSKAYKIDE